MLHVLICVQVVDSAKFYFALDVYDIIALTGIVEMLEKRVFIYFVSAGVGNKLMLNITTTMGMPQSYDMEFDNLCK